MVHLTPDDAPRSKHDASEEPAWKPSSAASEESSKRRRLSLSADEQPYTIKHVYKSSDVKKYKEKKRSPAKVPERPYKSSSASSSAPSARQTPDRRPNERHPLLHGQPDHFAASSAVYSPTSHPLAPDVLRFKSHKGGRVRKEQMFNKRLPSAEAHPTSIVPRAPVPPEHLYGSSNR